MEKDICIKNKELYSVNDYLKDGIQIEKAVIRKIDENYLEWNESIKNEIYLIKYNDYVDIKKRAIKEISNNKTSVFFDIISYVRIVDSHLLELITKYSIDTSNINSLKELLISILKNKKIYSYVQNIVIDFLSKYGFVENVYDDNNNPTKECSILYLLYDLLNIYICFYLFNGLINDSFNKIYDTLFLYSILKNSNKEQYAIDYITNYLNEKENNSYIKYSSIYNKNQKRWEIKEEYNNIIQQCLLDLRMKLSSNYIGYDYYICENCGKPFERLHKNQKVHKAEQDYECRKLYDRKRQQKSYYQKKANN